MSSRSTRFSRCAAWLDADLPRLFSDDCVLRVRRLVRVRRDFGGSYQSVGLILELLDRIEELEAEQGRRTER